jgi:hypothetical protein
MQRLQNLEKQVIASSSLDGEEFKSIVFGPNYAEKEKAAEVLRSNGSLHHYHINEDSKETLRHKTLRNVFTSRASFLGTFDDAESNINAVTLFCNGFVFYDLGFCVRSGVHYFLYFKALNLLGTEKHRFLLEKAFKMQDIGCFGLT